MYQPGFTETNAGSINLTVDDKVSDVLRSRLRAVASYELGATGPIAWALQGSLVWSHRLSASSGHITAGLIDQPEDFTIETVLEDRDSLQAGLAMIGKTAGGHMFLRYDGDFRPEFEAHAIAAGMAIQF
jgi:hypothetical protein